MSLCPIACRVAFAVAGANMHNSSTMLLFARRSADSGAIIGFRCRANHRLVCGRVLWLRQDARSHHFGALYQDGKGELISVERNAPLPILPIVTREEFIASSPPQPILLYSVCLVAAARREVPQQVFDSVRYAVNSLIKAEDVLSTASIVNIQSLLVLAMVGDCHSSFAPSALSTLWVRLGCAIRMVSLSWFIKFCNATLTYF